MTFPLLILCALFLILRPQEYNAWLNGLGVINLSLGAACLAWLVEERKPIWQPTTGFAVGLAAAISASVVVNDGAGALQERLLTVLPSLVFFVLVSTTVTTLGRLKTFLDVMGIFGVFIALHSIQQYHTGVGWTGMEVMWEGDEKRVRYLGIFADPNELGAVFVTTLPIIGYWFISTPGVLGRAVAAAAFGIVAYAIEITGSRGTLLSVGVIVLMLVLRRYGVRRAVFAALAMAALGAIYKLGASGGFDESSMGRLDAWYVGMELFRASPLWGVGFDNFTRYNHLTAHNSLILVLAELGLFGFFCWFSLVLTAYLSVWPALRAAVDDRADAEAVDRARIGLTLLLSFSALLVAMFFLSLSYITYVYIIMALAVGFAASGARQLAADSQPDAPRLGVFGYLGATAVGLVALQVVVKALLIVAY